MEEWSKGKLDLREVEDGEMHHRQHQTLTLMAASFQLGVWGNLQQQGGN